MAGVDRGLQPLEDQGVLGLLALHFSVPWDGK